MSRSSEIFSKYFLSPDSEWFIKGLGEGAEWHPVEIGRSHNGAGDCNLIGSHLRKEVSVGQLSRTKRSNFFVLDFDYPPQPGSRLAWEALVKKSIALFDAPKLLVRSSSSGGIHAWFFVRRESVYQITERVQGTLLSAGIKVRAGEVEVYTTGKNLRLPFGPGSEELGLDLKWTGRPTAAALEALEDRVRLRRLPSIESATPRYRPYKRQQKPGRATTRDQDDVNQLLMRGLSEPKTMHESLQKLIRYFFTETGERKATYERCKAWVEKFPHHRDLSKDYRVNSLRFFKKLEGMVGNWCAKASQRPVKTSLGLPESMCRIIVDEFLTYSHQRSVFKLMQFILYVSSVRQEFQMSRSFLIDKEFGPGMSLSNYQQIRSKLEELGWISIRRIGNNFLKQSTTYVCNAHGNSDESCYSSIGSFIIRNNLLHSYSPYIRRQIMKEAKGSDAI